MASTRKLTCAGPGCRNRFTPARSTAKFCSPSCSQRARRGTKKPAAKPVATKTAEPKTAAKTSAPKRSEAKQTSISASENHQLVVALRRELEDAEALDTFEGQLAVELAKRLVQVDSNPSALADKVRAARAAALGQVKAPGGPTEPTAPEPDDEVTKARKAKEAKAAAAAGEG